MQGRPHLLLAHQQLTLAVAVEVVTREVILEPAALVVVVMEQMLHTL